MGILNILDCLFPYKKKTYSAKRAENSWYNLHDSEVRWDVPPIVAGATTANQQGQDSRIAQGPKEKEPSRRASRNENIERSKRKLLHLSPATAAELTQQAFSRSPLVVLKTVKGPQTRRTQSTPGVDNRADVQQTSTNNIIIPAGLNNPRISEYDDIAPNNNSQGSYLQRSQCINIGTGQQLVPIWSNIACRKLLDVRRTSDYSVILKKLCLRDPLLLPKLKRVLEQLGSKGSANAPCARHLTHHPSATSGSLFSLRITACYWKDAPGCEEVPALLVEHGSPLDLERIVPRLLRDHCALNQIEVNVAVVGFQGQVSTAVNRMA